MKFYLKNLTLRWFTCHCMQSERNLVCVLCKKFLHLLSRQLLWPVQQKSRTMEILKRVWVWWTLTSICELVDGLAKFQKLKILCNYAQTNRSSLPFQARKCLQGRMSLSQCMLWGKSTNLYRTSARSTTPTYHGDLICISSATFSFKLLALKANHPNRPG